MFFPQAGYLCVWAELTAALDGLGLAVPSPKALRGLRLWWGLLRCVPYSRCWPGRWASRPLLNMFCLYRTVAFHGCLSLKVPDTPRYRCWLLKMNAALWETGYPVIQLMTLVETGTRALAGAVFCRLPTVRSPGRASCCTCWMPRCWC